ncbi:MAG: LicD family protein [Candidatus Krumholzibacteria bacterium]|jgi:hypothetical protein|nr:LicD family protein [Candidatus Krumholzibacteria bacterium]
MKYLKKQRKSLKKRSYRLLYPIGVFLFGKKECGKDTRRCRYHGPCCTKNLKLILEYSDRLFRENGIGYWLDYGTLLGAVREKDLIDYDTDVDLGMLYRDRDKLLGLKERIEKDGFVFRKDHSAEFYRIALSEMNSLHADVFLWKRNPDGVLYREDYMKKDDGKGKDFHEDLILKLEEREIDGRMYPVPSGPEEFCRFRFGENWRERIRYGGK